MVEAAHRVARRAAFRVDSGIAIGAGHAVRCLALAQQLRALGWQVHFICRAHDGHLGAEIEAQGFRLQLLPAGGAAVQGATPLELRWFGASRQHDARETAEYLATLKPDWLVVDHYGIDGRWEAVQAGHVGRIMVIDDLADRSHAAALLVDQNLQSRAGRYAGRVPAGCRTLLGPRFALLRPEFGERAAGRARRGGQVRRVLACVGGADPKDVLPKIVAAWAAIGPGRPALDVAVGAHTPGLARLSELCSALDGCTLHVQTDRMAMLMAQADLLICAAGSINWERCCLGVPAMLTLIAPNQADNLRLLTRARTGMSVGDAEHVAVAPLTALLRRLIARPSLLSRIGQRSIRLVDGRGAYRVAIAMSTDALSLRPATLADGEAAWPWRNQESTRRYFTDPRSLPLDEHLAWWSKAVVAPDRSLMVAQVETASVGIVRVDHEADRSVVSIYLDPALTGLGVGTRVIDAVRRVTHNRGVRPRRLCAFIDPRNAASRSAFEAAGFRPEGGLWVCEGLT